MTGFIEARLRGRAPASRGRCAQLQRRDHSCVSLKNTRRPARGSISFPAAPATCFFAGAHFIHQLQI